MGIHSRRALAAGLIAGLALAIVASPAQAATKTAKPGVAGYAWYWEDQQQQTVPNPQGGDAAAVEGPNPFCPAPPGNVGAPEPTCKSGRLPVEVRGGDYKTPNMISTLSFDVTVAPLGSKVKKFTVVLKEADDEQSKPLNVEGHEVQACLVREFFGDGEARRYKEAPKFKCSKSDPVGVRKKVKPKKQGGDPTFEWTFDLTKFAQTWVKGSPATAVMFVPAKPKKVDASDENWRVVFTGAVKPEEHGVKTTLVYEPAALEDPLGGLDFGTVTGGSGSGGTGGFGTTSSGSSFSGSSSSAPSGPSAPVANTKAPAGGGAAPAKTTDDAVAAAETEQPPAPIGVPWYMWLAILAGVIGFSLVRNFVLESATGIRPNGVLAQIQQINARRRGTALSTAASETSPLTALRGGLASAGAAFTGAAAKARDLIGKLSAGRR